jgi:multidrug efflux pump subunit AcrB
LEDGVPRVEAALRGAREVGFTVISITFSLIAVFLPILLMGGIVGRLFREFAVTLSLAILISMVISLTTTPMLCAVFLKPHARPAKVGGRKGFAQRLQDGYARSLARALDHSALVLLILFVTIGLNVWLISVIPKGFFPQQDTGRLTGNLQGDQSISFESMSRKVTQIMSIVRHDKAVMDVVGFTGSGSGGGASQTNTGQFFISLKPESQRDSLDIVMARLRRALSRVPGGRLFLQPVQDIRVGGRSSNAQYQYTILGDSTAEVYQWAPKLLAAMEKDKSFLDVSSDQQQKGLETDLVIDRDSASRLGLSMYQIDNTLYDAFGQRSVSTIYNALNQYHVVMEVAPQYWQRPDMLKQIWISTSGGQPSGTSSTQLGGGSVSAPTPRTGPASLAAAPLISLSSTAASAGNASATRMANPTVLVSNPTVITSNVNALGQGGRTAATTSTATTSAAANNAVRTAAQAAIATTGHGSASTGAAVATSAETMVPLSAIAHFGPGTTPLAVNHQSQFVATTISFNLPPNVSLGEAQAAIDRDKLAAHLPADLAGGFAGTALVFQQSLSSEGFLVVAALAAIYIVLGVLYESFVHPITILSTLPSAGVGAIVALLAFQIQFTIIALIGVILLIGIVKKNAILMIDFALEAERHDGMGSREAIFQAAVLRFRPIMMTTSAALLGALPLCVSFGEGSELRQPLGISIVGGLLVSQVLTLYTTPIVYLYLDRARLAASRFWRGDQAVEEKAA